MSSFEHVELCHHRSKVLTHTYLCVRHTYIQDYIAAWHGAGARIYRAINFFYSITYSEIHGVYTHTKDTDIASSRGACPGELSSLFGQKCTMTDRKRRHGSE